MFPSRRINLCEMNAEFWIIEKKMSLGCTFDSKLNFVRDEPDQFGFETFIGTSEQCLSIETIEQLWSDFSKN